MEKMDYLIRLLRRKSLELLKNSVSLKESKLKQNKLSALIKLFNIIYKYTQKLDKIQEILYKLENENKHEIFKELLKSFVDNILH